MANILETLRNAQYNLTKNRNNNFARAIGEVQLDNAIKMLDKGYPLDSDIESRLDWASVSSVDELPQYESQEYEEPG